ncbi:MAG: BrnA antitoxin family protein [Chloroflexota bacterium]|nr:BrnA antitoxin family protein [Chloroflexota bacterium]
MPIFKSTEEEADWWDEHFVDVWVQAESVAATVALAPPRLTIQVIWPLKQAIDQEAKRRNISRAQLVREWIEERLDLPELTN